MRKPLVILLLTAVLFCGCGKQSPDVQVQDEVDSLVEQWLADEMETTQPVTDSSAEAEIGATPLDSFTYTIQEDGTAVILHFSGKETDVVISSHIGDAPVTEIGQYAFEAAWDVERITLPETVTVIGEQAFLDCSSLREINIPEGVTELRRATFAGCSSLERLTLPESVASTKEELFSGCMLTELFVLNPALTYESWGLEELDPKCTIHAPEGAAILAWAEENGFPTEIVK